MWRFDRQTNTHTHTHAGWKIIAPLSKVMIIFTWTRCTLFKQYREGKRIDGHCRLKVILIFHWYGLQNTILNHLTGIFCHSGNLWSWDECHKLKVCGTPSRLGEHSKLLKRDKSSGKMSNYFRTKVYMYHIYIYTLVQKYIIKAYYGIQYNVYYDD